MASLGLLRESRRPASGKSCLLWAKSERSLQNTPHSPGRVFVVTGISQNRGGVKKSTELHYFYRFVKEQKRNQSSYDDN